MNMPLTQPALILPATPDGAREMLSGDGAARVTVLPDVEPRQLFKRRAVKQAGTPQAYSVEWVVLELADGTRVYVEGAANVVVTKKDMMP